MALKYIINVDESGDLQVCDRDGNPMTGKEYEDKGQTGDTKVTPMPVHGSHLVKFDSVSILTFEDKAKAVAMTCVKRANCTWYCY